MRVSLRCPRCRNNMSVPPVLAVVGEWHRQPGKPIVLVSKPRISWSKIRNVQDFPLEPAAPDSIAIAAYRHELRMNTFRHEILCDVLGREPEPITSPSFREGIRKEAWFRDFYSDFYSSEEETFRCGPLWNEIYSEAIAGPRTRSNWGVLTGQKLLVCSRGHRTQLTVRQALRLARQATESDLNEVFIR